MESARREYTRGHEEDPIALLALVACAAVAFMGVLAGDAPAAKPKLYVASAKGVGPYHLGDSIKSLHKRKLIGKVGPGCELDPGQRVAALKRPAVGFATFDRGGSRVTSIQVSDGVKTAAGIKIGSSVKAARNAYPNAAYIKPDPHAAITSGFLFVGGKRHPKLTFTIDVTSHVVTLIGVPSVSICE